MELEKVAKTHHHNDIAATKFEVNNTQIDAVLMAPKPEHTDLTDHVVGIEDTVDIEGNRQRRFLKLPKHVTEARVAVIEFYDSHEKLVKGIGATAIVSGAVTVGSLFVKRLKNKRTD